MVFRNLNGVYQICNYCMLTQCTQLECNCAWGLTFNQSYKLVQFMPMQKPHKCCNEGKGLRPFKPCHVGRHPLVHPCVYALMQGRAENSWIFSKICSMYLVIFTPLDHFYEDVKVVLDYWATTTTLPCVSSKQPGTWWYIQCFISSFILTCNHREHATTIWHNEADLHCFTTNRHLKAKLL